jgi:tetratricopeptide (TPR) repeat protein
MIRFGLSTPKGAFALALLLVVPTLRGQGDAERYLAIDATLVRDDVERVEAYFALALEAVDPVVADLAATRSADLFDAAGVPKDALLRATRVLDDAGAPGFRRAIARLLRRDLSLRSGAYDDVEATRGIDGVVRDFAVVGPFGRDENHYGGTTFEPERSIDFSKPMAGTRGEVRWTPLRLSFAATHASTEDVLKEDRGCAYAVAGLVLSEDATLDVRLSTAGSAELFVGGRRALVVDRETAFLPPSRSVRVRFGKGEHRLLVKMNAPYQREFMLEILREDGSFADLSGANPAIAVLSPQALLERGAVEASGSSTGSGDAGAFVVKDARNEFPPPKTRGETIVRAVAFSLMGLEDFGAHLVAEIRKAPDLSAAEIVALRTVVDRQTAAPEAAKKAETLALARKLAEAAPGHPIAAVALAEEDASKDKGEEALARLDAALTDHPKSRALREAYGKICERLGFVADAERSRLALATAYPSSLDAAYGRAELLARRGDFAGAYEAETRALDLDRSHAATFVGVAYSALRLGRLDDAFAHATTARRLDPSSPSIELLFAAILREKGDFQGEEATLRNAVDAYPNDAGALHLLKFAAFARGDVDAGVAYAARIVEREPDHAQVERAILREARPPAFDPIAAYAADVDAALKNAPDKDVYPDASVVLILDQVTLVVREDGTARQEIHQIHKLQDARGRDELGTIRAEGDLGIVRTIEPDGTTLWPNALQQGVYETAGLRPGVFVERRFYRELQRPFGEPPNYGSFLFQDTRLEAPFHFTRYVVATPEKAEIEPVVERFPVEPKKTVRDGYVVRDYLLTNMPRLKRERAMPPPTEIVPRATTAAPADPAGFNRGVLDMFEAPSRATPAILEAAKTAAKDATDPIAVAKNLYDFVLDKVASEGGFSEPTVTLLEGAGPRLPLFAALLTAAKVPWSPCFVAARDDFRGPNPPSGFDPDMFETPLVRIEPPGASPVYVAVDSRYRPFGELSYRYCDAPVYVARRGGGFFDRTPAAPSDAAKTDVRRFDLVLDAEGVATGKATIEFGRDFSAQIREALAEADRSQYEPQLLNMLMAPLGRFRARATGKVSVEGMTSRGGPLVVSVDVELKRLVRGGTQGTDLASPLSPYDFARRFVDRTERTHPVVFRDTDVRRDTAVVKLDPSWRIENLPPTDAFHGAPGSVSIVRTFDEATSTLTFERVVQWAPFTVEPSRFAAFSKWLSEIDAAEHRVVRLTKTTP